MRSRWLLFGILLLVLSVASENSVLPAGKSNPCPDPDNPNMVQRPDTTIEGEDGDTVILPCSTQDKTDISHDTVEWFKGPTTEDKPIHKYVWRSDPHQTPRDDFKGLTSLSEDKLSSGNCSLNLRVTTSHSGSYYCCVAGRLYCTVTLKVHPKGKDTSQEQDDPNNGTDGLTLKFGLGVGIPAALLLIIIIIGLGVLLYRNPRCPQTIYREVPLQARQPPENQGNKPVDPNQNEEQNQMNEDQDDPAAGN